MYAQQAILRTIFTRESTTDDEFKKAHIQDFLDIYKAVEDNNEIEVIKGFERNNFRTRKTIIEGLKNFKK